MPSMHNSSELLSKGTQSGFCSSLEDIYEITLPNWVKYLIEQGLDLKRKGSSFINKASSGSDKIGD